MRQNEGMVKDMMINTEKTGRLIRSLRTGCGLTQKQLGERLHVSDRTISKWETGAGSPEVSVLSDLARVFGVRVEALLQGEQPVNRADQGNLRRLQFYLCPTCGNILTATGPACVSCCGKVLQPCAAKRPDEAHSVSLERVEDEDYIHFSHEMTKEHHMLFFAQVDSGRLLLHRLYPEQGGELRLPHQRMGRLYYACSRDGLFVFDPGK